MKFVGAHVSASGGVDNAPLNAMAIGVYQKPETMGC
jgi:deoxyribonuclease-4